MRNWSYGNSSTRAYSVIGSLDEEAARATTRVSLRVAVSVLDPTASSAVGKFLYPKALEHSGNFHKSYLVLD